MDYLRTPDTCFENLPGYPWAPHYAQVDDGEGHEMRMHYLDEGEPFCCTYGDGIADVDITATIEFHRSHGRLATVTAVKPPGRFGALVLDGQTVTRFAEKPGGTAA